MFALQALYMSAALYYAYSLETQFIAAVGMEQLMSVDASWISILLILLVSIIAPIILIFVTYHKLYTPEKNKKTSNNASSWSLVLTILGFFFGLVIGAIPFAYAYDKLKELKLNPASRQFA